MGGKLVLVGTPIGNLEDMTPRAVRMLKEADLIACEDTRTSAKLLNHFEITTPVTSYHKFNERDKSGELTARILGGETVALITDAGMPAISDPGEVLVRMCLDNHIPVTAAPGPSALVTALALSGQDTRRFVYEGFLPAENREKKEVLSRLADETRTIIVYEAPHRLVRTLEALSSVLGADRKITLLRELTKHFEEILPTTIGEALSHYEGAEPRGEFVLVIAGKDPGVLAEEEASRWESVSIASHVAMYESQGMDRKSAMKAAARDRGLKKRDIYAALLEEQEEN